MLSVAGADHIITMDLHASQIQVDTMKLLLIEKYFVGFFRYSCR